jgi:hypothetical protein
MVPTVPVRTCLTIGGGTSEGGPEVHVRSYLDPKTGKILYAEVALAGEARGFDSSPLHWTNAASRT